MERTELLAGHWAIRSRHAKLKRPGKDEEVRGLAVWRWHMKHVAWAGWQLCCRLHTVHTVACCYDRKFMLLSQLVLGRVQQSVNIRWARAHDVHVLTCLREGLQICKHGDPINFCEVPMHCWALFLLQHGRGPCFQWVIELSSPLLLPTPCLPSLVSSLMLSPSGNCSQHWAATSLLPAAAKENPGSVARSSAPS